MFDLIRPILVICVLILIHYTLKCLVVRVCVKLNTGHYVPRLLLAYNLLVVVIFSAAMAFVIHLNGFNINVAVFVCCMYIPVIMHVFLRARMRVELGKGELVHRFLFSGSIPYKDIRFINDYKHSGMPFGVITYSKGGRYRKLCVYSDVYDYEMFMDGLKSGCSDL